MLSVTVFDAAICVREDGVYDKIIIEYLEEIKMETKKCLREFPSKWWFSLEFTAYNGQMTAFTLYEARRSFVHHAQ